MRILDTPYIPCLSFRVETPTDALMMINSRKSLDHFVEIYGNVEVVRDFADLGLFRVPEFADQIKAYTTMKEKHCDLYGSN